MPIHMGVMCERCRNVHFIATSLTIRPSTANPGMYRLSCRFGCNEITEFRKDAMRPYRVQEKVFQTGFAEEGEYEVVNQP